MEDFRSGYILELTGEDRQKALEKFGECPELKDGNITSLRSWLQEQTHLKGRQDDDFLLMFLREAKFSQEDVNITSLRSWLQEQTHLKSRQDDEFLLLFLREEKFSQKQARERLEKYIRNRCSDPHKELHLKGPELEQEVSEIILAASVFVLPTLPRSARRTMFSIAKNVDGKKYSFAGMIRAGIVSTEIMMLDQVTQINGHQVVVDAGGISLDLLRTMTPAIFRKSKQCLSHEMPLKKDATHLLHCPLVVRGATVIAKLVMGSENAKTIFDHGNSTAQMQKELQPEVLPEEYGGKAGSCLEIASRWHQHVCSNLHRLGTFHVVSNDGD